MSSWGIYKHWTVYLQRITPPSSSLYLLISSLVSWEHPIAICNRYEWSYINYNLTQLQIPWNTKNYQLLTLILLPGAFFVLATLFCLFWLEIIIKKIWKNLTFIFLMWTIFFWKTFFQKKDFFWLKKRL